jgi:hypothetical protein
MKKICLLVLVGLCMTFFSCGGKQALADVAEEDSLCIDTVATLDDVFASDPIAEPDTLTVDTLF